jgi:hypothetical protein
MGGVVAVILCIHSVVHRPSSDSDAYLRGSEDSAVLCCGSRLVADGCGAALVRSYEWTLKSIIISPTLSAHKWGLWAGLCGTGRGLGDQRDTTELEPFGGRRKA